MPFPNVSLDYSLESMHCQKTTNSEIVMHKILDPYFLLMDKESKISIWSSEMMVYKMIEFDLHKKYDTQINLLIPTSQDDKKEIVPIPLPIVSQPLKADEK